MLNSIVYVGEDSLTVEWQNERSNKKSHDGFHILTKKSKIYFLIYNALGYRNF